MNNLVTAIVPMRHSSERVVGKNYRPLAGRPLYHHVVRALLATPGVGEVIIDTDSETIFADAAEHLPEVRLIERPEHLRDGHTPMNDVLANSVLSAEYSTILQTHSTNPFVRAETFQAAIDAYFAPGCDSVFGVSRIQGRLWTKDLAPVNHDPKVLARTQDLDPVYLENSCFYLFDRAQLTSEAPNRIGALPRVVEVDPIQAIDIDEEQDFALAVAVAESSLGGIA